jgi:hypothetical protein
MQTNTFTQYKNISNVFEDKKGIFFIKVEIGIDSQGIFFIKVEIGIDSTFFLHLQYFICADKVLLS